MRSQTGLCSSVATVFLRRGDEDRHEQRGGCEREQRGDHLQTKKKDLRGKQRCQYFYSRLPASKRVRKLISAIETTQYLLVYGSPSELT